MNELFNGNLYYGQIRHTNYEALRKIYGKEPPWEMENSPHVDLVKGVLANEHANNKYVDYMTMTRDYDTAIKDYNKSVKLINELLKTKSILEPILVQHGSIIDGNHRYAVSNVIGKQLDKVEFKSYQSIMFNNKIIEGRRHYRNLKLYSEIIKDKIVLDLGCNLGANCLEAANCAKVCIGIDRDMTSMAWIMKNSYIYQSDIQYLVWDINQKWKDIALLEYDVVFLFSIALYIKSEALKYITNGKIVIFEDQTPDQEFPSLDHNWEFAEMVPYSIVEPDRTRNVFIGYPKKGK